MRPLLSTTLPDWVSALVMLMLSSWLMLVGSRDLGRRAVTETSTSSGVQWINHMCAAQCDAFCSEDTVDCRRLCRSSGNRSWIIKCHEQEREVQSTYYDSEDSYLTRSSECPGTCSVLKDQEDAGYFIPMTPEVVLVRNPANHSATLTWSPLTSLSHVVYVVQEKMDSHWTEAHLVMGADHFTRSDLGVCSRPTYRVAAVSRYGSFWFSDEVTAPDMIPSPPRNLQVSSISHDSNIRSFVITISWLNPTGWDLQDLRWFNPYSWDRFVKCPSSVHFPPRPFDDSHQFSNNGNNLTFHIADFSVGCKVIYAVNAISKCNDDLVSDREYLTMDLSCRSVKEFYNGEYCTPPPFNPPGNVQDVHITVTPGLYGARAHVTWLPPSDLGSAGVIGYYAVYYGFVDEGLIYKFKDDVFENITLSSDTLQTDVSIPEDSGSGNMFGILIMAGAPGQTIEFPIGIINIVHASFSQGHVLLDEDIVVYHVDNTREVRVFWNPPSPDTDATGVVALQWGPLSKPHLDLIANVDDDGEVTYNTTGQEVEFHARNTTVISENRTSFDIQGLVPSEAYGIKVLVLYDEEEADNISDEKWTQAPTHVFVMPAPPIAPTPTDPNGWTSKKPTPSLVPASDRPLIGVSVSVSVAVLALVPLLVLLWRRWRKRKKLAHLTKVQLPEFRPYTCFMPRDGNQPVSGERQQDDWELPHSGLKVGRVLGAGAFGQVMLGRVSRAVLRHRGLPLRSENEEGERGEGEGSPLLVPVAIKMLKEGCDELGKTEFLREIQLMKELGQHSHVVSMLGCCTLREPYCLVVEHMAKGDLLNHLKNIRNNIAKSAEQSGHYENHRVEHASPLDLLSMARQIALGMEFLADRGYVHRDLAARNVLLGEKNEVKIGDFGLARYVYTDRIYINRKGGKLPLKWMAMESIFDLTFSTASDVWAFGVVLFEIVTLGGTPYPTIHIRDLLKALKGGYRMERPDNCSEEMYRMMRACWRESPEERPSFLCLRQWLEEMMQDCSGVQYLDMQLSPYKDYYTCPDSQSSTDSSVLEDSSPPLSPLFSKDSGSDTTSLDLQLPAADDVTSVSSPERKLTASNEQDSVTSKVTFDIIVHKEESLSVSGSQSSDSSSSPRTGTKSVRFSRSRPREHSNSNLHMQDRAEVDRASDTNSTSSGLENSLWTSVNDSDSPALCSPDAAWDDVFTMDPKDSQWSDPTPRIPRSGQPRVCSQERHPCGLFRVSVMSDTSSLSEEFIMPLMSRRSHLDSQGESIYTSFSSGESVSLPLSHQEMFQRPRLAHSGSLVPSSAVEHSAKPPGLRMPGLTNLYHHSPPQQRSQKQSKLNQLPNQLQKPVARDSTAVLMNPERNGYKDGGRRPVVFTKAVSRTKEKATAL